MVRTLEEHSRPFWELSYAISRILSESEHVETALLAILRLLKTRLDFQVACLWRVDYEALLVRCAECIHESGDRYGLFERLSRARTFSFGQGLPGKAWEERTPIWYQGLNKQENFPRLIIAKDTDLESAVAAPIFAGRRVLGFFELFANRAIADTREMTEFLLIVGGQVGTYVEKMRVEEQLTGAEEQFRLLAETSADAVVTITTESKILFCNAALENLFGYKREELYGKLLHVLIPQRLREAHDRGIQRYIASGEKAIPWSGVRLPGLHRDGHEIPLEIAFGEHRQGSQRLFSGYLRQTERED